MAFRPNVQIWSLDENDYVVRDIKWGRNTDYVEIVSPLGEAEIVMPDGSRSVHKYGVTPAEAAS